MESACVRLALQLSDPIKLTSVVVSIVLKRLRISALVTRLKMNWVSALI